MIQAMDTALLAAAEVLRDRIIDEFGSRGGGYKHGLYAEGNASDVKIGAPSRDGGSMQANPRTIRGTRRIRVYTDAVNERGRPYPYFWEVGHKNVKSGQREYAPVFGVVMAESAALIKDAMIATRSFGRGQTAAFGPGGIELISEG